MYFYISSYERKEIIGGCNEYYEFIWQSLTKKFCVFHGLPQRKLVNISVYRLCVCWERACVRACVRTLVVMKIVTVFLFFVPHACTNKLLFEILCESGQ